MSQPSNPGTNALSPLSIFGVIVFVGILGMTVGKQYLEEQNSQAQTASRQLTTNRTTPSRTTASQTNAAEQAKQLDAAKTECHNRLTFIQLREKNLLRTYLSYPRLDCRSKPDVWEANKPAFSSEFRQLHLEYRSLHATCEDKILMPAQLNNRTCLLYTSPSPRDQRGSRMPSSA